MPYGQVAKGTTLSYSATEGGSYTALDGIKSIKAPEIGLVITDRTALGDAWKKKGAAHAEAGTITVTFFFDKTKLETLHDMLEAQIGSSGNWWKITAPDGTVIAGQAFLAKQDFGTYTVGEEVMFDCTLEATGEWDVTPAA